MNENITLPLGDKATCFKALKLVSPKSYPINLRVVSVRRSGLSVDRLKTNVTKLNIRIQILKHCITVAGQRTKSVDCQKSTLFLVYTPGSTRFFVENLIFETDVCPYGLWLIGYPPGMQAYPPSLQPYPPSWRATVWASLLGLQ